MKTFLSFLLTFMVLTSCNHSAYSQNRDKNSYNINRAQECMEKDDYDSAREFINKELADNPKSAIAYDMLGYIFLRDEAYGSALTAYTNARKHYPKKDKEGLVRCCYYLARTHLCLEDTVAAISTYKEALDYNSDDTDCLEELADVYFYTRQYPLAEELYVKLHKLNPGNAYPYYGLARNAYKQQQYDKAKEYVDKAKLLDSKSTMPHILMMRIHRLENDYPSMLKEALNVLDMDPSDNEAYQGIFVASDSICEKVINMLIKKSFENSDNRDFWEYTLGCVYSYHKEYKKAISTFQPLVDNNSELKTLALQHIIDTYAEIGNHSKAYTLCNQLLDEDTENAEYTLKRGDAKFYLGMLDGARQDYEAGMRLDTDYGYYCCYRLGWIAEIQGKYEEALQHYDKGIAIGEEYAYTYMMKGNLLKDYLNQPEMARECFLKCIELEKGSIDEEVCRQYAYLGLGNSKKTVEITDSLIAAFPDVPGTYYDAACVYCRLGNKEKGLEYLTICLQKGYRDIAHIMQDNDVDLIRNTDEFKQLIEKYSKLYEFNVDKKINTSDFSTDNLTMYEIPIVRQSSNTYLVKAAINDLKMDFILDTGCSDISLSSVESEFMLKNGYLKQSDLKGQTRYTNATGETHTAQEILVREIRMGELVLHNLRASIIPNQKAPLLLGQNVLTKFGKVEIDHKNKLLKIGVKKP